MTSRSISPDCQNGTIAAMTVSAHLQAAVDQSIESLCFAGTHSLDADLRAQPKASQGSFDRLIQEQHRRTDEVFGPQNVSAEALATILDDLFKLDSGSISEHPTEPGQLVSPVVDIMTDTTAKIFKKEMKQRIHEWEGAFRTQFGRDPSPQDKNRLKHIYELYKVVKNRVLKGAPGDAPAVPNSASAPRPSSAGGSTSNNNNMPAGASATPIRSTGSTGSINNNSSSMPSPSMTPAVASNGSKVNNNNSLGANVQLTPMGQTPVGSNGSSRNPPNNGNANPGSRAATPTGPSSNNSNNNQPDAAQPMGPSGSSASSLVPTSKAHFDQLVSQKRALKRELHAFEGDFTKQNGRAPAREDRLPLIDKYQRYGELKMAIQNYQNEHGGTEE